MNKIFEVEIRFNQNTASNVHFQELEKQVKESLVLNVSKGMASARTISVKEKRTRRKTRK